MEQVVCTASNGAWISTNFGNNYTRADISHENEFVTWKSASSSSDGKVLSASNNLVVGENQYPKLISLNSRIGAWSNWNYYMPSYDTWSESSIQISGNGKYVLGVPFIWKSGSTSINAQIFISTTQNLNTTIQPSVSSINVFQMPWSGNPVQNMAASGSAAFLLFQFFVIFTQ